MHFAAAAWLHAARIVNSFSQNMQGDVERMSTNLRRQFTPKSKNTCCDLYPFIYLFTYIFGVTYQALEISSSGSACVETLNGSVTWATTQFVRMVHRHCCLMRRGTCAYSPPQLSEAELCRITCMCCFATNPRCLAWLWTLPLPIQTTVSKRKIQMRWYWKQFDLRKSALRAGRSSLCSVSPLPCCSCLWAAPLEGFPLRAIPDGGTDPNVNDYITLGN